MAHLLYVLIVSVDPEAAVATHLLAFAVIAKSTFLQ